MLDMASYHNKQKTKRNSRVKYLTPLHILLNSCLHYVGVKNVARFVRQFYKISSPYLEDKRHVLQLTHTDCQYNGESYQVLHNEAFPL